MSCAALPGPPYVFAGECERFSCSGSCRVCSALQPQTRRLPPVRNLGLLRVPNGNPCVHCRYFYATLLLGTPQRQFAVIVDTGSTITYVPCASCGKNCGPHHKARAQRLPSPAVPSRMHAQRSSSLLLHPLLHRTLLGLGLWLVRVLGWDVCSS